MTEVEGSASEYPGHGVTHSPRSISAKRKSQVEAERKFMQFFCSPPKAQSREKPTPVFLVVDDESSLTESSSSQTLFSVEERSPTSQRSRPSLRVVPPASAPFPGIVHVRQLDSSLEAPFEAVGSNCDMDEYRVGAPEMESGDLFPNIRELINAAKAALEHDKAVSSRYWFTQIGIRSETINDN